MRRDQIVEVVEVKPLILAELETDRGDRLEPVADTRREPARA